jgi:CHRD domain
VCTSRRTGWAAAVLLLASVWLVATSSGAAADQQTVYFVEMSGDQVVGNPPGDPDGFGTATITVNHRTEQVCLDVDTTNVATPTEDYILRTGAAGEPAEAVLVIFNLDNNDPDPSTCFVRYPTGFEFKELWKKFIEPSPEDFNLSVHNFEHADFGAIRGQLTPVS